MRFHSQINHQLLCNGIENVHLGAAPLFTLCVEKNRSPIIFATFAPPFAIAMTFFLFRSGAVGQVFVHDRFETSYYQLLTGGRLGLIGGYSQFELEELQPQLRDLAFIEDVAVDWMTENIYYTRLNTINVIDSGFNFHIELFRNTRTRITALALHPIER